MAVNGIPTDDPSVDDLSSEEEEDEPKVTKDNVEEYQIDVAKLHPLLPEVIRNQATINIG